MSNVHILNWSNTCNYEKVNGLYVLKNKVWIDFTFYDEVHRISVDRGAMTDGLSVPKIFRWYLPDWNDENPLYNIAGICHDGAYGSEKLSKNLADELFYQGLLKAGISPRKASVAKWAVEHLAGLHYGRQNDDFGIAEYVTID